MSIILSDIGQMCMKLYHESNWLYKCEEERMVRIIEIEKYSCKIFLNVHHGNAMRIQSTDLVDKREKNS